VDVAVGMPTPLADVRHKMDTGLVVAESNIAAPGMLTEARGLDLAEAAEYDEMSLRALGRSKATIQLQGRVWHKLGGFCPSGMSTPVHGITPTVIRRLTIHLYATPQFQGHPYVRDQSKPRRTAGISADLRSLRASFNRLAADGIIPESPFRQIKLPAANYQRKDAPTNEEVFRLLGAIDISTPEGFADYCLIACYADSGARLSGLSSSQMDGIDLKKGTLVVKEKGDRTRTVFVGRWLQKLLWRYVKQFRPEPAYPDGNYIFLSHDGRQLTKNRVEAKFRKYALKAGLDPHRLTPHSMRRYFCTQFVRNGGAISDLQLISGHANLKSLEFYLRPTPDDLKRSHDRYGPLDRLQQSVSGLGKEPRRPK